MAAEFVLTSEAEQDVSDAYDWYENRRHGLGEDFLSCVDACLQGICRMPEQHAKIYKDFRRVLVRRFPYFIIYTLIDETISINCVFHSSRNPDKWRERLP